MTTLDIDFNLKGAHDQQQQQPPPPVHKDPRPFRVPHNYKQYQRTILSRSFTTFTDLGGDKVPVICVRGERIEGSKKDGEDGQEEEKTGKQDDLAGNSGKEESRAEEDFHMMNSRGETNINFYDFQRTWSIEDFDDDGEEEVDDDEEAAGEGGRMSGDLLRRRRRLSLTAVSGGGGCDNKPVRYTRRRIIRPPSPKTKQIIRVNVVRVANS